MDRQKSTTTHGINVTPRTRALFVVLAFGVAGLIFTALLMWLVPSADDILNTRHHSIFTRVLDVLAVPALLFFMVIIAYACTELYKIYRLINDPETYRRNRQKTNSVH